MKHSSSQNTTLIEGKAFAAKIRNQTADLVEKLKVQHNITPGLAVILVGDDPASQVYVRNKEKQTIEAGMHSFKIQLPEHTNEKMLLAKIEHLNNDRKVHGILVQLPLPKHINERKVIEAITPAKDVDGFHPMNMGKLTTGQKALIPCTPKGCMMLLKEYGGDLSGKKALIIGRSNIVGKPMALLLLHAHCTVTVAHSRTANIKEECQQADIVIAAVGKAEMVKGSWLKEGAIVIDVGINRITDDAGNTKLVGDVDFDSAANVASAITPVPGGVGPMTIACLLRNTLRATCTIHQIEDIL